MTDFIADIKILKLKNKLISGYEEQIQTEKLLLHNTKNVNG